MPDNNLLQADVPRGATIIPQTRGTAPGLICQVGLKVVYAVPGVPYEMSDMFDRAILPDLLERQREAGKTSVIRSRVLRTWGASESALAESVAEQFRRAGERRSRDHCVSRLGYRGHQGPSHRAG